MKKRISLITACCLILPAFVCAQNDLPNSPPPDIVKVVRVHGNAGNIANAAGSYSGAHYTVSGELNAIVIRGRPDAVASVERTIQELDALNTTAPTRTGARDLEVTAYVIGGSRDALPSVEEISDEPLAPVVKQLRAIFPYKHYAVLATMLLRAAPDGKANSKGMMPALSGSMPSSYFIGFDVGHIINDTPPLIHLTGFSFGAQVQVPIPGSTQFMQRDVSVNTDVDLHEGQKVVVGKANVANSDTCFFLVLSARLVP